MLQPYEFGKTSAPRMRDRPDGKLDLQCKVLPSGGRVIGGSDPECRRILALCLGGIGDTVLAFAALRDLRRACPNDHITALAMWPQSADLLEDLGLFDVVLQHNFQTQSYRRSLWASLKQRFEHYDASILAFPANRFEYNALAYLLGAKRRFGHSYVRGSNIANLRFLLTDRIDQQLGRHVIDENRAVVALFTGQKPAGSADIRLGPLDPEYHYEAAKMLGHLGGRILGIHPGCSSYKGHAQRRWPAERFGQLCRRAHWEFGLQPVVFGMPNELDLKLRIQAVCPEVFFAHGETIRDTAAQIAQCTVFASNDSGLAHIASALDVPVVMACGATDARGIGPYGDSGRVVVSEVSCAPCFQVGRNPLRCAHAVRSACMKQISVDRMLQAVASCLPSVGTGTGRCDGLGLHASLALEDSPAFVASVSTGVGR